MRVGYGGIDYDLVDSKSLKALADDLLSEMFETYFKDEEGFRQPPLSSLNGMPKISIRHSLDWVRETMGEVGNDELFEEMFGAASGGFYVKKDLYSDTPEVIIENHIRQALVKQPNYLGVGLYLGFPYNIENNIKVIQDVMISYMVKHDYYGKLILMSLGLIDDVTLVS